MGISFASRSTFRRRSESRGGSILLPLVYLFALSPCKRRLSEYSAQNPTAITSPIHFYDYFQNRVLVAFRPKHEDLGQQELSVQLSKNMTYDQVSERGMYHTDSLLEMKHLHRVSSPDGNQSWGIVEPRSHEVALHHVYPSRNAEICSQTTGKHVFGRDHPA